VEKLEHFLHIAANLNEIGGQPQGHESLELFNYSDTDEEAYILIPQFTGKQVLQWSISLAFYEQL